MSVPVAYETVIRPGARRGVAALGELWDGRELLYFLAWRDVKVRYKQTALGAGWAVIQPALMLVVFTVIFGRLAGLPSDGAPYTLFTAVALVPWTYLAAAVSAGGLSLAGSQHLIAKVYFPRLLVPLAAVLTPLVDLAIACLLIVALMAWYGVVPTVGVVLLPLCVLLALVTAAAASAWLSALNVRFRDVRYVLPFVVQLWMYASPVVYAGSIVPERWRLAYALNPMVTVVEGFRAALLGTPGPTVAMATASTAVAVIGLVTGWRYFQRVEGTLVDLV